MATLYYVNVNQLLTLGLIHTLEFDTAQDFFTLPQIWLNITSQLHIILWINSLKIFSNFNNKLSPMKNFHTDETGPVPNWQDTKTVTRR